MPTRSSRADDDFRFAMQAAVFPVPVLSTGISASERDGDDAKRRTAAAAN